MIEVQIDSPVPIRFDESLGDFHSGFALHCVSLVPERCRSEIHTILRYGVVASLCALRRMPPCEHSAPCFQAIHSLLISALAMPRRLRAVAMRDEVCE